MAQSIVSHGAHKCSRTIRKVGHVQLLLHALMGWASVPAHGPRCMRREGLLQFIAGGRFGCETEV